jgi:hypothetical protein
MVNSRRPIFRESALKHYWQRREEDILPQTVSPPFFLITWALVGLLIIAVLFLWFARLPVYASAPGIVQVRTNNNVEIVNFFPVGTPNLTRGATIQIKDAENNFVESKIVSVEGPISPSEAQERFKLRDRLILLDPSIIVTVNFEKDSLNKHVPARALAGSRINTRVQIGEQQALAVLFRSVNTHVTGDR